MSYILVHLCILVKRRFQPKSPLASRVPLLNILTRSTCVYCNVNRKTSAVICNIKALVGPIGVQEML